MLEYLDLWPALAVDVSTSTMTVGLVNWSRKFLVKRAVPSPGSSEPPSGTAQRVLELALELCEECGEPWETITSVGIALPGMVEERIGRLHYAASLPAWRDTDVAEIFGETLDRGIWLGQDVQMAALGEMEMGAAHSYSDFLYVTVGTGVGIALVIGGRLYRRSSGNLGHCAVGNSDVRCECGRHGCLVTQVSAQAIAELAQEELVRDPHSLVLDLAGDPDAVSAFHVARAARAGDPLAHRVLFRIVEPLAQALATFISVINPQVTVVGGCLADAGDEVMEHLAKLVQLKALASPYGVHRVVPAQLGPDATLIGVAAAAVAHRTLQRRLEDLDWAEE